MFFKKNRQDNENITEEDLNNESSEVGIAIYFTPHIIYVYICENGSLDLSDGGTLEMIDKKDRFIGITGNIITHELLNMNELPEIIETYQLKQLNVPIVQIHVNECF